MPPSQTKIYGRVAWLAALAWTLVVGVLAVTTLRDIEREAMDTAYTEARANLNKDITFRRWGTDHGGVYVPVTERQPPIPWMSHVPGRDVVTTDGHRLTLINPASMLRQMMERYTADYGITGRITGLRYLNPGNAPDPWERAQLEAFERGDKKEVWAVADMNGQPHLRHLRAMFMEPGCEKCHAILGYKTGDMRGATGVNLPLAPYRKRIAEARRNLGLNYGMFWLLGLAGIGWTGRVVTLKEQERRRQEADRLEAERLYRGLFEQSRDGIMIIDPASGRMLEFNTEAHRQLGYDREEFAALRLGDLEVNESPEEMRRHIGNIEQRGWDHFETRLRHKDGSPRDILVTVQMVALGGNRVMYGTTRDVTEKKITERSLELYANIFRSSGEAILVTDRDNRVVALNPAFTRLTGYGLEDIQGRNPRLLASGRTPRETYRAMWASLRDKGFWQGELWDRSKDGRVYPKWAAISAIRDERGEVGHYIASFTDISERKAAEERIDYLARHDALTSLANRYSLEELLDQSLRGARRDGRRIAAIFIDMDRFKTINDTLGHQVGDQLLVEVARRLKECVRESDIVARFGGDEFVIVLSGVASAMDAAPVAGTILRRLGEPYCIEGGTLHSSPSIGIGIYPEDGEDGTTLLKNADTAMYHAKEQGRNNIQFFTPAMNEAARERLNVESELRTALAEGQFELHYQAQVDALDERIHGVEALIRWRHPNRGLVPPFRFIPIAEESGLIEPIGAWVLDESCRQLAAWRAQGITGIRMAVNLSAQQLRAPDLVETVRAALDRHGLGRDDLEIELTESVAMENPAHAIGQLRALRELGVRLAIDDFGTGYSSLAYLKLLPIQSLKLDRAFVRDLETDENDAAIATATLALAHSLGLAVVAEGVETAAQRDFLRRHRCDLLQGYLFGRPEPAEHWREHWSRLSER